MNGLGDRKDWGNDGWNTARVAVMTALSLYREDVAAETCHKTVEAIEGRRGQPLAALASRNVLVLSGGTLERYLPHFKGDPFKLTPEAKKQAVEAELLEMKQLQQYSGSEKEKALAERYGELFAKLCDLPSKNEADVDVVLRRYLSDFIHELQKIVKDNPEWQYEQIKQRLSSYSTAKGGFVSIQTCERMGGDGFKAVVNVSAIYPRTQES